MGRQNYMTITVADTIQDMFNEFVTIKGITKTAALNDVVEMYMLAKDEELYLNLKKKYLNVEGMKNMIADRDSKIDDSIPEYLFMKLGISATNEGDELDGEETVRVYMNDEKIRGFTWALKFWQKKYRYLDAKAGPSRLMLAINVSYAFRKCP